MQNFSSEVNVMTNEMFDFFEKGKQALAPFGGLSEVGVETVEKIFKLEADIASDLIDYTVDQLRAFGTAEDPAGYVKEQGRLVSEYTGRAQQRTQAFVDTMTDVQKAFFAVAKNGYEDAIAAAKPAKATRKKAA
jgi:phasin family protein